MSFLTHKKAKASINGQRTGRMASGRLEQDVSLSHLFFLFLEMSSHDLEAFHCYRSNSVQVLLNTPKFLPIFLKYQCVFIINVCSYIWKF